jgi:membrane protein DedA with SNARE-associated domain
MAEGPILAIIAGFFIHLGYLDLIPSFALLMIGDFVPDSFVYYIGRYSNKSKLLQRYYARSSFLSRNLNRIEKLWHAHAFKTMFFTKLAYGLSLPLLIIAGKAKLPYKIFIRDAMVVSVIQYTIFLTIGYYFGKSYELLAQYAKYTGIGIALAGVLIALVYIAVKKYAVKEIYKIENENNI